MVLVLFPLQSTIFLSSPPQRWACLLLINLKHCTCCSLYKMLFLLDAFSVSSLFLLCSLEGEKKSRCYFIYFFLNVIELNSAFILRFEEAPLSGVKKDSLKSRIVANLNVFINLMMILMVHLLGCVCFTKELFPII